MSEQSPNPPSKKTNHKGQKQRQGQHVLMHHEMLVTKQLDIQSTRVMRWEKGINTQG